MPVVLSSLTRSVWVALAGSLTALVWSLVAGHRGAMAESSWPRLDLAQRKPTRRGSRVVWRQRVSCCAMGVWRGSCWLFGSGWVVAVQRGWPRRYTAPKGLRCSVQGAALLCCSEATSCLLPKSIARPVFSSPTSRLHVSRAPSHGSRPTEQSRRRQIP
jgi:hypothetical protein